jgi:hypothetical protein
MKGETLPPESRWGGIPTAQASRWIAAPPSSRRPLLAPEAAWMKESV